MRRATGVFLGVVFGLIILLSIAQADQKFAYIDLNKAFSEYNKTKDYDKALSEKENIAKAELEKKENEFKQYQDKYNLLSDNEKDAKKSEIEAKYKALRDLGNQKAIDLRKEQDEKMKEIFKDIEEAVKKYSEKDGLTFVFNDRVLIYQDKSLNITDKIIEIMNKGYKK